MWYINDTSLQTQWYNETMYVIDSEQISYIVHGVIIILGFANQDINRSYDNSQQENEDQSVQKWNEPILSVFMFVIVLDLNMLCHKSIAEYVV